MAYSNTEQGLKYVMSLQMVLYDSMQKLGGSRGMPPGNKVLCCGNFDHINLPADTVTIYGGLTVIFFTWLLFIIIHHQIDMASYSYLVTSYTIFQKM